MGRFAVPAHPTQYTKYYQGFRGVDFSTDPTRVSDTRSPWAPNLISDTGGNPEKRLGWRTLHQLGDKIYNIWRRKAGDYIVHSGTTLYQYDGVKAPTALRTGVCAAVGSAFIMNEKLWMLTGLEYLVYDGTTIKDVQEIAYVPTTTISASPMGGGTNYEQVNLLSDKRKNSFLADGRVDYQLDTTNIDDVVSVVVDGKTLGAGQYSVLREMGRIVFYSIPQKPSVAGQDNVIVTFTKRVAGYAERIAKCTLSTTFGSSAGDRAFVTGNADMPATDWVCAMGDPTYFPDLNYTQVGMDGTAIMGYCKIGDSLCIIKQDNQQDTTVFLRTVSVSDSAVIFPVRQGIAGVGAVSPRSIGYLMDEPLFLSANGVYGVVSSNITARTTLQNRSYFVDARLARETELAQAVSVTWNGWYVLCVNGNCYVLDGKQDKSYKAQSGGDYIYECYFWNNIPAICFLTEGETLFFGTADGRICRMNNDLTDMTRYADDTAPICAQWATKADDDGDFMRRKTMLAQGSGVLLKPYTRSSARIIVRTEHDFGTLLREKTMEFAQSDSTDPTASNVPQVVPFGSKIRRYLTLQVTIENNKLHEGFGIYGIIKRYQLGKQER